MWELLTLVLIPVLFIYARIVKWIRLYRNILLRRIIIFNRIIECFSFAQFIHLVGHARVDLRHSISHLFVTIGVYVSEHLAFSITIGALFYVPK